MVVVFMLHRLFDGGPKFRLVRKVVKIRARELVEPVTQPDGVAQGAECVLLRFLIDLFLFLRVHLKRVHLRDPVLHLGIVLSRLIRIAQMYSLQMYSQKEKKIDEKAKENALRALSDAVRLSYRLDELASADFYNLSDQPEFRTAIEQAM